MSRCRLPLWSPEIPVTAIPVGHSRCKPMGSPMQTVLPDGVTVSPMVLNYGEKSTILFGGSAPTSQSSTISYLAPGLAVGTHQLQANYPGDNSFSSSTSPGQHHKHLFLHGDQGEVVHWRFLSHGHGGGECSRGACWTNRSRELLRPIWGNGDGHGSELGYSRGFGNHNHRSGHLLRRLHHTGDIQERGHCGSAMYGWFRMPAHRTDFLQRGRKCQPLQPKVSRTFTSVATRRPIPCSVRIPSQLLSETRDADRIGTVECSLAAADRRRWSHLWMGPTHWEPLH